MLTRAKAPQTLQHLDIVRRHQRPHRCFVRTKGLEKYANHLPNQQLVVHSVFRRITMQSTSSAHSSGVTRRQRPGRRRSSTASLHRRPAAALRWCWCAKYAAAPLVPSTNSMCGLLQIRCYRLGVGAVAGAELPLARLWCRRNDDSRRGICQHAKRFRIVKVMLADMKPRREYISQQLSEHTQWTLYGTVMWILAYKVSVRILYVHCYHSSRGRMFTIVSSVNVVSVYNVRNERNGTDSNGSAARATTIRGRGVIVTTSGIHIKRPNISRTSNECVSTNVCNNNWCYCYH